MKKIIVTGGAGFIGTNLCLSALTKGYEVIVFDNLSRKGTSVNLQHVATYGGKRLIFEKGDIRNPASVNELIKKHATAEAIFHFAGQVAVTTSVDDPREDFEINLIGTFNLLEALRAIGFKGPIIYSSTNKVYGGMENIEIVEEKDAYKYRDYPKGLDENIHLDFHSPYGCSKGGADQYMIDYGRIYGLKTVVLRQSCIYGYHQYGVEDQGWVAWFTIAAIFDKPLTIYGTGKQVRDVLFIDDLVELYWLCCQKISVAKGKYFNIGGGKYQMSLLQLISYLEKLCGKDLDLLFSETRPGDQPIFVSDITKVSKDLGWKPTTDVETGVKRLYEWIGNNQPKFRQAGII